MIMAFSGEFTHSSRELLKSCNFITRNAGFVFFYPFACYQVILKIFFLKSKMVILCVRFYT